MFNNVVKQVGKFGIVGMCALFAHLVIFYFARSSFLLEEQLSNFIAFSLAFTISWSGHYFWTFQTGGKRSAIFFFIVALIGYGLNAFWVWLTITHYGLADFYAIILMGTITPLISFILSKFWAFRAR